MPHSKLELNSIELSGYVANNDIIKRETANGTPYCWITIWQSVLTRDSELVPYKQSYVRFELMCRGDAVNFAVKRLHRGCRIIAKGYIDSFLQIMKDGTKRRRQIIAISEILGIKLIDKDANEEKIIERLNNGSIEEKGFYIKDLREREIAHDTFEKQNMVAEVTGEESE